MDTQKWAIQAKASGYPLCEDCLEPLTKDRWLFRRCGSCELGRRRALERRRDDEELAWWYRRFGVE